jgi:hypothetical protein
MENKINRRSFVKSSSALLAGLSLGTGTSASPEKDVDAMKGVQLAIATICLDGFGNEYFEKAFEVIPKTGIKNVEFSGGSSRLRASPVYKRDVTKMVSNPSPCTGLLLGGVLSRMSRINCG